MNSTHLRNGLCGIALALATAGTAAQNFDLGWYTIDGGGGMFSTGGAFELSGTIGQPDAGAMTGGDFELVGGFWGAGLSTLPCAGFVRADSNCDGTVNNFDIDAFVLALTDAGAYALMFPNCNFICNNDVNQDGRVDNFDIDPFVVCLLAGGCP